MSTTYNYPSIDTLREWCFANTCRRAEVPSHVNYPSIDTNVPLHGAHDTDGCGLLTATRVAHAARIGSTTRQRATLLEQRAQNTAAFRNAAITCAHCRLPTNVKARHDRSP